MLKQLLCLLLFSINITAFSQTAYFQQHVDYQIEVTLDDQQLHLHGFEKLKYTNYSKDTLKFIYFHLWPNAYKNDRSAYVEMDVENKQTKFYYSKQEDRGYIDSLEFKVNNENVETTYYNAHEDILVLNLNQPLLPSKSIEITTPFFVKIPTCFSRLGHTAQQYQISQWYPKPAVFDRYGWHPMPYLDQGEFYSEFGDYTVQITLPENYIVAATGDVQEASEKTFIKSRIADTAFKLIDTSIVKTTNTKLKTITFKQKNVHDFAWVADKDYRVESSEAKLPSGKIVTCYSYFKPEHAKVYKGSSKVIAATIEYLSNHVGEYPYEHASIADATLLAGGGMEYPNVTIIGEVGSKSMLQTVIVHEVGHNWFYGLLGSNEREHPWLDEGINSYYEQLIDRKLQDEDTSKSLDKKAAEIMSMVSNNFVYQLVARVHDDQKIELPATEFTSLNYGSIVYYKTAAMLHYLAGYMGEADFEKAMKTYFATWKYKHPYPDDFKTIFQAHTSKDINWFFEDGLLTDKKIDFKLISHRLDIPHDHINFKIKSRTQFNGPVSLSAMQGDSILETKWIDYPYTNNAFFSSSIRDQANAYKLNAENKIPEINTANNRIKLHSLFKRIQPAIRFGGSMGISEKRKLYVLPALGYNTYDQFMAGLLLHNLEIPNKKFQFALATLYGFGSKQAVGSGFISYTIYPHQLIHRANLGILGRSYHDDESHLNINKSIYTRYIKIAPFIDIDFKKTSARSAISNKLLLKYYYIGSQNFKYTLRESDSLYIPSVSDFNTQSYGLGLFTHANKRTFNPYSYSLSLFGNDKFLKANLEAHLRIDYFKKGKAFYARAFVGKFFNFKSSNNLFLLKNQQLNASYTAANDFMYDDIMLARNEQSGILSQQIALREGGFKIKTHLLNSPIGQNDNWLAAVNFRTDLPMKLPLKFQLFLDAGTFAKASELNNSGNKLIYDAGVELHLFADMLIIYAPIMMSKDFKDYTKSTYAKNRFLNTMTFSLNLDKIKWYRTQNVLDMIKL